MTLPKSARRSNDQKAQGYLGAAREGLRHAKFFRPDDPELDGLMEQLESYINKEGDG